MTVQLPTPEQVSAYCKANGLRLVKDEPIVKVCEHFRIEWSAPRFGNSVSPGQLLYAGPKESE